MENNEKDIIDNYDSCNGCYVGIEYRFAFRL